MVMCFMQLGIVTMVYAMCFIDKAEYLEVSTYPKLVQGLLTDTNGGLLALRVFIDIIDLRKSIISMVC